MFGEEQNDLKFDEKIGQYGIIYRKGRLELLDYMLQVDRDKIDVGVWTNFDQNLTETICKKYFGRYMRDLLFVLPTNRALHSNR